MTARSTLAGEARCIGLLCLAALIGMAIGCAELAIDRWLP
jgi:uncharacterized membrane protein